MTTKPIVRDIRVQQTIRWLRERGHEFITEQPTRPLKPQYSQPWLLRLQRPKVDFVWCNDLDTLLFGILVKRRYPKVRIIYDCHDIYIYQLRRGREILLWPYFKVLEVIGKRYVDTVVVASEGFRDYFRKWSNTVLLENVKSNSHTE